MRPRVFVAACLSLGTLALCPACFADERPADAPPAPSTEPFVVPAMAAPALPPSAFQFTDVGAKIPNYTPGSRWGTQGEPLTLMQNPLPAEVSMQAYSVPQDFELALWAKESAENWPANPEASSPMAGLRGKPIAMAWDERGRLWLCETIDYPNELQLPGKGRDRIKICEDTDNDGRADKFTVFAEHLSIPSTLICSRGGVIVQDGQSTVFLKDIDGDDQADFRQVLITGWALGDTHGGVSNFQYGPDNWIWAMQGYNNSEPIINGQPQMKFRQGFWRFQVKAGAADTTAPAYAIDRATREASEQASDAFHQHTVRVGALEFVRATNNNTWGLGFSEEGYVFGSTANNCPSVHMPIPNRYYDNVAGWSPKTLEKISPDAKFRALDDKIRQVDVHGGYTAACGHALYTARNYPRPWWNRIAMVCEPTGHLIGAFVLDRQGADYRSQNLFNVVASIDDWSAPIQAEVGPDGNVWFLDWYNYIVQHNPTPAGFETGKGAAYESDLRDKRLGRIYRLLYSNGSDTTAPSTKRRLVDASSQSLVEALGDDNLFWRRTAQRLLVERDASDLQTLNALVALASDRQQDEIGLCPGSLHAIWTLAGLADAGNADARRALAIACSAALSHPSSSVRAAAVSHQPAEGISAAMGIGLHQDSDPRVRLALLLKLADQRGTTGISALALAALLDGPGSVADDEVLLDAWTMAAAPQAIETLVALGKPGASGPRTRAVMERVAILAEHIARARPSASQIDALLEIDPTGPLSNAVWTGMAKGWPKDHQVQLAESSQRKIFDRFLIEGTRVESQAAMLSVADRWGVSGLDDVVARIQSQLFATATDVSADGDNRISAWDQAIRLAPGNLTILEAVESMLNPQLPPEIGSRAVAALQGARVEGLASRLLELRRKVGPKLAGDISTVLLTRSDTTEALLDAIAAGQIAFSDLQLDQRQALLNHPERGIASRAAELMTASGAMATSNREALVEEWMPVLQEPGSLENGIAMYKKHCAQCHKHGEMGVAIGPNLTGMAVHPKAEILMNILDPSRSVESNFRTYQILTVDGGVLTGMLSGESANAIRIINAQGKEEQVLREDIDELSASTKSLMPEGFELSISRQEMADLLTFLGNRGRYTPLSLANVATLSSPKGLPAFRGAPGDKITFAGYGGLEIAGIPFELTDPQEGRTANVIALQGQSGRAPRVLPDSVSVPCSGKIAAIHLLGGVAAGGYPISREPSTSLVVRCVYQDGTTEDHALINGKQIASYREKNEVPDSTYAMDANGRQVRYVKIEIDGGKELQRIDFVKGEDFTLPLVFGITVESASDDGH